MVIQIVRFTNSFSKLLNRIFTSSETTDHRHRYSGDSRQVGLFHYLLSGDDRLMRQTLSNFAASVTFEGLTQSRFPSHVPQLIAGFSLYWVLQVCDHHLYFGDTPFTRSFLPRIDGVLDFFSAHIDDNGLVSGLPDDVWQYVDWVTTWGKSHFLKSRLSHLEKIQGV